MPFSYISRNDLKARLADTATTDDAIYRIILEAIAKVIDDYCHWTFHVHLATRYLTPVWSHLIDLDQPLISVTSLKTDADGDRTYENTWAATDYDLKPDNASSDGAPYREIEITPNGDSTFPTTRRGVEVVGKWGWVEDLLTSPSTLNEALDTSETGVDVTAGTDFEVLQTILIDSEQMYITAIATNTLTVERAVNGTAAATHSSAAAIKIYRYPETVVEAAVILASRYFRRKDAPFGVTGFAEGGAIPIPREDPDVVRLLNPYRKLRAGVV